MSNPQPDPERPKTTLQQLADRAKEAIRGSPMEHWHLSSEHVKAQIGNGLDEFRQLFHPGVEQIQPGQAPGLWGMPTTGEATHERLGDALDVPGKFSLDDLRGHAKDRAAETGIEMQKPSKDRGREI